MYLSVNGERVEITHPNEPLLWVLHDELGLNSVRYGCGIGACGCCTVLADGEAIRSCQVSAREVADQELRTLEGLAEGEQLHPVQQAFVEGPLQCGWCLSGHVLCAVALIERHPDPSSEQIDEAAGVNLCRCGGYNSVRANVARAAEINRGQQ